MGISTMMGHRLGYKHFAMVFSHNGEMDMLVPSKSAKHICFYNVCTGPKVAFNR